MEPTIHFFNLKKLAIPDNPPLSEGKSFFLLFSKKNPTIGKTDFIHLPPPPPPPELASHSQSVQPSIPAEEAKEWNNIQEFLDSLKAATTGLEFGSSTQPEIIDNKTDRESSK